MSWIIKITFLVLLLIAIIVGTFLFILKNEANLIDGSFNYNNVSVSAQDYNAIKKTLENETMITVCNLDNDNCIALIKMEDFMK